MICPFCGTQNHPENTSCAACGFLFGTGALKNNDARPDWEVHGGLLQFASFFITVREVLFEPRLTFRNLKSGNALFNAFLFAILGGTAAGMAGTFWQFLARSLNFVSQDSPLSPLLGDTGSLCAAIFFIPLSIGLCLFVLSGLIHLSLTLCGAGKSGFAFTFKVCAYALGATSLLGVVPVLGTLAGFIALNLILLFGLKEAHYASLRRTLLALILPFLFVCALLALVIFLLVISGLAVGFQQLHQTW